MALGAWPGFTAKALEGVSAISWRAAAATKVCERHCFGQHQPQVIGFRIGLHLQAFEQLDRDQLALFRVAAFQRGDLGGGAVAHQPLGGGEGKALRDPAAGTHRGDDALAQMLWARR